MINLQDVKRALRVTHDEDDELLVRLIGSAVRECLAFLDAGALPGVADSDGNLQEVDMPEDVFNGVVLMVSADYEGDPLKREAHRAAAEQLWMPYRAGFCV